ncbi:TPA: gamma-glutamylcyclotransferase [Legionella pneumophila]|nr:gamma-glutamylcyclotransferase [Legionella pneumophila]HAU1254690.1 gamma-glutamylcyclotransferase [Legionella pneumophila]HAU1285407.1 gamma-glutamylcyclotransferase [Legionella pneumophila]HAU1294090.1 gamma-glutamylcyclotransferase [Legionella pneumophila]HAU1426944.1 gamma-glutamylcyclotransferase [Legionella pneumophila]
MCKILKSTYLSLLLIVTPQIKAASDTCYPPINPRLPQYIAGYGSLIDEQSKKTTDPKAYENIPVLIKGFKRSWGAHGNLPGFNATFLSLNENERGTFNGIIYRVSDPKEINSYDKRETVYCRKKLSTEQIKIYTNNIPEKIQVWIYYPKSIQDDQPSPEFPITQSYVDIFIRGCIKVEEKFNIRDFAKECILTTDNWPVQHWVNDRIYPRRPSAYEPYARKIDELLKELLPNQFKNIRIE